MATLDHLIEQLRRRRAELGLSLQDVADRVGKNRSTVYSWEVRRTDLPTASLISWARALGYEVDWGLTAVTGGGRPISTDEMPVISEILSSALQNMPEEDKERFAAALMGIVKNK